MQLTTPITPSITPAVKTPVHEAFSAASAKYMSAIDNLTTGNELPWEVLASNATQDLTDAVALLKPHANSGSSFTDRNLVSSVSAATKAVSMLAQIGGPTAGPNTPTIDDVVETIRSAESALWWE